MLSPILLAVHPARADVQPSPITGFMFNSEEWLDASTPTAQYGFYQFMPDGSTGITAISPVGPYNNWANCGGAYIDNKYYCFDVQGNWMKFTSTYRVLDATTWDTLTTKSFTYTYGNNSEENLKNKWIPGAIGYDAVNDVLYAFLHQFGNSEKSLLATIDKTTGEYTKIAETNYMTAMACASDGKIYAIDGDGNLYSVSSTGELASIGFTGYYPARDSEVNCGATINYRDGKLYWSFYGFTNETDRNYVQNGLNALLVVDTNTAETKQSWVYPRHEYFSALAVQNAHPLAPDNIYNLSFNPTSQHALEGTINFTVPSLTYGQTTLNGDVVVEYNVDGGTATTATATAGQDVSYTVNGLTEGKHTVAVTLQANNHQSITSYATTFFGVDKPLAPQNLTLTYDSSNNKATLNWEQSEIGVEGGSINLSDLRYQIVRMPDEKTVARSAKGTTFSEDVNFSFGAYYYRLIPYYNSDPAIKGDVASSNSVQMGKSLDIPYSETFDTPASFNSFTTIDANGDGGSDWEDPCWKYDEQYYCAFYYGKTGTSADDWLITPRLNLSPEKIYRLTYKYYAYYGYGSHIEISLGSEPTFEGMNHQVFDKEFTSSYLDNPGLTETVFFTPREGESYIGFHHLSSTMEHLSIDDILVEVYSSSYVPDKVVNLTGSITENRKAHLSFSMPTTAVNGKSLEGKLSATISHGDDNVSLKNLAPGEMVEWTDENSVQAINSYSITVSNDAGQGLTANINVDLSLGVPVQVTGVKARLLNNNEVELTWDPSTAATDEKGNPIDLSAMRYLVYKPVPRDYGTEYKLIGRDLNECRFIDDDPLSGYGDESQITIYYYVAPVNGDDEGYATASNVVFVGTDKDLPFEESFNEASFTTHPWASVYVNGATWYTRYKGYDPMADGQIGVLTCEVDGNSNGTGYCGIASPRIDLTSVNEPQLSFKIYRAPSYQDGVRLSVMIDNGSEFLSIPSGNISAKSDNAGYETVTLSLADFANSKSASIIFLANVVTDNNIHIDDIKVSGTAVENDVKLAKVAVPAIATVGEPVELKAWISNNSSTAIENITVNFSAQAETLATSEAVTVAPGKTIAVTSLWTPTKAGATNVCAELNSTNDTNANNNRINAYTDVKEPNYPHVSQLNGKVLDNAIELTWSAPDAATRAENVLDDIEAYDSFAIDNVGAWIMADVDEAYNYQFGDAQGNLIYWPNSDMQQAFIVFDSSDNNLPQLPFAPTSGAKMFAAWAAAGIANNDWLISPELPGDDAQLVSFYVRAAQTDGSEEPFNVCYSDGSTNPTDFTRANGDVTRKAGSDWTLCHFTLPAGAKRFAINYVGENGNGLLIDDIMYYGLPLNKRPDGYNIYRNGEKLNSELITGLNFTDTTLDAGENHTYNVVAVFNGIESKPSADLSLYFSSVNTIDTTSEAKVFANNGAIVVENANGHSIEIFNVSGQKVAHSKVFNTARFEVTAGVYIVKIEGQTPVKTIVK